MTGRRTRSGYDLAHARTIFPVYEATLKGIAARSSVDDAVIAKRLRIVGSALLDMAQHLAGKDDESTAIDAVDRDLARVLADRRRGEES